MIIDEQDKVKISDGANPNLYYAVNAQFAYKGFDFGFLLQVSAAVRSTCSMHRAR